MSATSSGSDSVYSKNTLEFVAVAKSYCDFLEHPDQLERNRLIDVMVHLLPLLYLKGSLLPETTLLGEGEEEAFATEMQYSLLVEAIAELLGADDAYLDVFHPDITLADGPVAASVSESLADIWQELYNFTGVFRLGYDETMNDALYFCRERFGTGWGQSLLTVLRALHALKFGDTDTMISEEDFF